MPEETIDIKLIYLCLDGDRVGQQKLYNLLLPYLNAICKRYLVNEADLKDVLQDTFINIFKSLNQFNIEKASIRTWTATIAINNCLKCNSRNAKKQTEELVIDLQNVQVSPAAFEQISNAELLIWLKKMPQQYYEVFNLYVIDGFSHDEISKLLNIKPSLSRKRLSRSREWIKKRLQTDSEFQFNFAFN